MANLLSIVFHPLMMATYLFAAIIFIEPMLAVPPGYTKIAQWLVVLIVWITTFVIPVMSLVLLKFTGNISSLKLENRQERLIPFFYVTLFYGFTAYYFTRQLVVTELSSGIFIAITLLIFIAAIITIFWKISVHSLALGGIVGILLILTVVLPESSLYYLLLCSVFISGLVLTARLQLQAHTPLQVYTGFMVGILISFMIIFWV